MYTSATQPNNPQLRVTTKFSLWHLCAAYDFVFASILTTGGCHMSTITELQEQVAQLREVLIKVIELGKKRAAGTILADELQSKVIPSLDKIFININGLAHTHVAPEQNRNGQDQVASSTPASA